MVHSPDVRRAAFARFVQRTLRNAQESRGLSVPRIAEMAGIASNTIYRWRDGNWAGQGPTADNVVAFCDALDIPPQAAFSILWPGKTDRPAEPEPEPLDADMRAIARKLKDPNTSDFDRAFIHETLRQLANRAASKSDEPRRPGRKSTA